MGVFQNRLKRHEASCTAGLIVSETIASSSQDLDLTFYPNTSTMTLSIASSFPWLFTKSGGGNSLQLSFLLPYQPLVATS